MMILATTINRHLGASIARLYIANTIALQVAISFFKLLLVVINKANCLVVTNQLNAIGVAIICHNLHIKIWRRFHKLIGNTIFEPVALPAIIPTFNQKTRNAKVLTRINILHCVLSRSTVAFARSPSPLTNIHCPPNTHEFLWFNPREILARWIIQIQHHAARCEIECILTNNNHAPRRRERKLDISAHTIRKWRNISFQRRAVHLQSHAAIVIKRSFVNRDKLIRRRLNRKWSMYGFREGINRMLNVIILITVWLVSWNAPRAAVCINGEFR